MKIDAENRMPNLMNLMNFRFALFQNGVLLGCRGALWQFNRVRLLLLDIIDYDSTRKNTSHLSEGC